MTLFLVFYYALCQVGEKRETKDCVMQMKISMLFSVIF